MHMNSTVIEATIQGEDFEDIAVTVARIDKGYSVTGFDLDSMNVIGGSKIFSTLDAATAYALEAL